MKKIVPTFALYCYLQIVFGHNKKNEPLTHDDILKWERITETEISNDGKTIVYKLEPWKGDPTLKITTPKAKEIVSVNCGTNAQITSDSKFVIFTLKPAEETIRQLKLKKTKKEDLPINKLAIFNLKDYKTDTIDELISVKVPEKWAGWIAYQTKAPKDTTKKEKGEKKSKDEDKVYPLYIRNLNSGERFEFPAVNNYEFAEEKEALVFISEGKDSTFDAGVYHIDLAENKTQKILDGKGKYKQLTIDKTGEKVAFVGDISKEEEKEMQSNYSLYYWHNSGKSRNYCRQFKSRHSGKLGNQ